MEQPNHTMRRPDPELRLLLTDPARLRQRAKELNAEAMILVRRANELLCRAEAIERMREDRRRVARALAEVRPFAGSTAQEVDG